MLLPLRHPVHSEELVQRLVRHLRVLGKHLRVVLEQGNGSVVLAHVGHDPRVVELALVLRETPLREVARLFCVDHRFARELA